MVLGQPFDIKNYLNKMQNLQKTEKKERNDFLPLLDNSYKGSSFSSQRKDLSTIANDRLPSYKKRPFHLKKKSFDVSTTFSNNNNSNITNKNKNSSITLNSNNDNNTIIYDKIKIKNNDIINYPETEANSGKIDLFKSNDLYGINSENFNLLKAIKNIKRTIDLSNKDRSVKNILRNRIAYDPKNSDIVFKPVRIMNDFNNFQQRDLDKNREDISSFLNENKEISKKNVLIKYLENQKKDYYRIINQRQKSIDHSSRTIETDENNFDSYTTNQKMACKRIEVMLNKLMLKNKRLSNEEKIFKSEVGVREDERKKILEQIDELRIIAKFVTRVLGSNIKVFKAKILPDYNSDIDPDYEKIASDVCERYKFLLNEDENDKLSQEDLNNIKEMNDLNDCEDLYYQFHKIEENIIETLKSKSYLNKEIDNLRKEEKKQFDDYQKRIKILENELNTCKSLYEIEKKEYEDICVRKEIGIVDLDKIVLDLYYFVMTIFKKFNKEDENNKNKLNTISISNALKDSQKVIVEKEQKLNKLIINLESYEKSNKWLFDRVVNRRRNENKELKVSLLKQIIMDGEQEKIGQLSPENKIIFIKRKAEPPYQPPKKDDKIKEVPEVVKQLENEELIKYQ